MSAKLKIINMSEIEIKPISALETIMVRHAVLRQGKPIETCAMDGDNLDSTYHFGLFYKNKLVATATFMEEKSAHFKEKLQFRLRGMGVLEDYQGLHIGKYLLNHSITFLKEKNIKRLWFNARIIAVNFYKNNGFKIIGPIFNIPNVGDHYLMHKKI